MPMTLRRLFIIPALALFVAAILWPAMALFLTSLGDGIAPRDGFTFTTGQLWLLVRTLLLTLVGAALCMIPATGLGIILVSRRVHEITVALLAAGLLCPPMVYAFGWQRILPASISPELRCVFVWAVWAWPLAAVVIGAGWSRAGKEPYAAALLDCRPLTAMLRIGLPAIAPHLVSAYLLLVVVFLGDYGVPHAFGLRVYATELLAWTSESNHAIDALWAAVPPAVVILLALVAVMYVLRRCAFPEPQSHKVRMCGRRLYFASWVLMAVGWFIPLCVLMRSLTGKILWESIQIYGPDLVYTVAVALAGAAVTMVLGICAAPNNRFRRKLLFLSLLFGTLPGAVVGQAMIAAYNRAPTYAIYDSWVIMALVHLARYAWIGLLVGGIALHSVGRSVIEQARTDGASDWQLATHVLLRPTLPLMLGLGGIFIALAVGDVAASTLVRVPGSNPIALMIIEKFHRLEDGMLVALSLMLVATAIACGAATALARIGLRRWAS